MGRKIASAVHEYFNFNTERSKSVCTINECGHEIPGKHGTNLLSHLSSHHPVEYTSVVIRNQKRKNEETEESNAHRTKRIKQDLLHECVNLVTVHGRPFSLINDTAFQNILKMIPSCPNLNISSQEVRNAVIRKAANFFRKKIGEKFRGKFLSLKIDAATCLDRSFIGINVQHIEEGKLVLYTLAVKEVYGRHTAVFIKELVENVLLTYGISVRNIYSITTDNGSNMIKFVDLVGKDQLEYTQHPNNQSSANNNGDDSDTDDTSRTNINDFNEELEFSLLGNEVAANDANGTADKLNYQIRSVRCAAHTLQLAVSDVLMSDTAASIVNKARGVCKKLRSPGVKCEMRKRKPIIDCTARWHSTLDMLERLLDLKDCCDDSNKDLYLPPQTWTEVTDLVRCLTPARIATKQLQEEQLVIGDFYRIWTQCKLDTAKIKIPLASRIVEAMTAREKNLFNNDVFLAAMFFDIRFNIILTEEQIIKASDHLLRTWRCMQELPEAVQKSRRNSNNINCAPSTSRSYSSLSDTSCESENTYETDDIENMLRQLETKKDNRNTSTGSLVDMITLLRKCLNYPRLDSKESILQFWSKKNHLSELYPLVEVALAVPTTQVSVERLFSSLKYILSPLRYNLLDSIIDDILVLRANGEDVNIHI